MNSSNNSSNEPILHILPDYIKEDLDMVVIGLNPSLTSAQIGHYFAGPGNHFWSCITEVGLVPEPVTCYDDARMLEYSIGFTNACSRATKGAADLSKKELKDGMKLLLAKLQRFCPKIVVFNGKGTYETFVRHKHFGMGKQPNRLEGTNSVVFVMPSSSARCAQLPRAADKIPFFSALKDLRDKIKSWSGGLSSGGRLVPLEEANGNIFPDHVDLELTRLYDAGKSNYSTDRAEKKRKANALNGGNQAMSRALCSDDNSRHAHNQTSQSPSGLQSNYYDSRSEKHKSPHSSRNKDERLPNIPNHNFFMSGQAISLNNGQWIPGGTFYNSSVSYQPYIVDSSHYSTSQQLGRFPINPVFRPNMLQANLPPSLSNVKTYSAASNQNSLSSSDERTENSFDTSSFTSENMQLHNSTDSSDKIETPKKNSKDDFDSMPQQSSTNFVSLLLSDSLSLPDSPCEFDKIVETRCQQPASSWQNSDANHQSTDPISSANAMHNSTWEHNNNVLVSSYFSARRQLPQEHPMNSMFSNFQVNQSNFSDINSDNHYQTSFSMSSFYSSPHSITGATNSNSSVQSPLSSDQVTSSLCSVKVTPDSTSLANRKRPCFDLSDNDYLPNKLMIPDDNNTSGHDQVTYTDL